MTMKEGSSSQKFVNYLPKDTLSYPRRLNLQVFFCRGWQIPPKWPGKQQHRGRDPKKYPWWTWEEGIQKILKERGVQCKGVRAIAWEDWNLFVNFLLLLVEEVRPSEVKWSCSYNNNTADLYSWSARFKSHLGHWLFWLKFLWFSLVSPGKCRCSMSSRPCYFPSISFPVHQQRPPFHRSGWPQSLQLFDIIDTLPPVDHISMHLKQIRSLWR